MRQREEMPAVFLSYAGPERDQALVIRRELESRGIAVSMDDAFDPGTSIMVNVGLMLEQATVVVALVTEAYLDRHYTEIEVSTTMANPNGLFLPVVKKVELEPRTEAGRGIWSVIRGKSLFRLGEDNEDFDRLAVAVKTKAASAVTTEGRRGGGAELGVGPLLLAYDWEDSHLLEDVESSLVALGVGPLVTKPAVTIDLVTSKPIRIGLLWTRGARASLEVNQLIWDAVVTECEVIYLLLADSPQPPVAGFAVTIPTHTKSRGSLDLRRLSRSRRTGEDALKANAVKVIQLNDNIPLHLLGDKYCANRTVARATEEGYELAVSELPAGTDVRLQAVLDHAAACRFRGDWDRARDLLLREPLGEARRPSPLALAAEADLISLEFELGHITGIIGRASSLLARCLSVGDWPGIISTHRQLGIIHEEQGSYTSSREHLSLAYHYSQDLLDTDILTQRIPSRDARLALTADCLREMAALEWRAGDATLASEQLFDAERITSQIAGSGLREYMSAVILYQKSRVDYDRDRRYEKAREALRTSYVALQHYENPIRLATVLEAIARLELDFFRHSEEQVTTLRPTLEKVQRVRMLRKHDYMIARTHGSLGDLEYALGNWSASSEQYDQARQEFNRLGKQPEAANAARSLARSYQRLDDPESALEVLEGALENLRDSDQRSVRSDIRSEMVRLLHLPLSPEDVDDSTEMTGVGEFSLHRWIRADYAGNAAAGRGAEEVVVGVGDDCAVMRLPSGTDLVVSTDSTPPSLLDPSRRNGPEYAARFAVVSSLSDVLAMGAVPSALLINLHVKRETPAAWARAIIRAAQIEARRYGAEVIGGDLKERDAPALTTTALGHLEPGRVLTRSAARQGQLLVMTLSGGQGGFHGLGRRWAQELSPFLSEEERAKISGLIEADSAFSDLGLPINAMASVMEARLANAAIDTSDGVLACAQLLGEASDVGIELDMDALNAVVDHEVKALAECLGIEPFLFALNAGHDWEVVFTSPAHNRERLRSIAESSAARHPSLTVIGRVVPRQGWSEIGVKLIADSKPTKHILPYFTDEKFVTNPYEDRAREWLEFARHASRIVAVTSSGGPA